MVPLRILFILLFLTSSCTTPKVKVEADIKKEGGVEVKPVLIWKF